MKLNELYQRTATAARDFIVSATLCLATATKTPDLDSLKEKNEGEEAIFQNADRQAEPKAEHPYRTIPSGMPTPEDEPDRHEAPEHSLSYVSLRSFKENNPVGYKCMLDYLDKMPIQHCIERRNKYRYFT